MSRKNKKKYHLEVEKTSSLDRDSGQIDKLSAQLEQVPNEKAKQTKKTGLFRRFSKSPSKSKIQQIEKVKLDQKSEMKETVPVP